MLEETQNLVKEFLENDQMKELCERQNYIC